jgi:hypothetical protein
VSASVLELRKFKLDQLPPSLRGLALIAIRKAEAAQKQFAEDIDSLLRNFARSELIDPDPDVGERAEERAVELENSKLSFRGLGEVRGKIALAKNSEDQPGCSTLLAPRPEPRSKRLAQSNDDAAVDVAVGEAAAMETIILNVLVLLQIFHEIQMLGVRIVKSPDTLLTCAGRRHKLDNSPLASNLRRMKAIQSLLHHQEGILLVVD